MRIVTFTVIMFLGQCAIGQAIVDFENFEIGVDSALVDSGEEGGFTSGGMFFSNSYNAGFDFFTDWAISSMRDTLTASSSNSTSAIAGGGDESDTYAVATAFSPVQIKFNEEITGNTVSGLYVTNSTYTALSMKDGDMFAKKFGGETGDDPDFFLLTIKAYSAGELSTDSVDFYLADYRFSNNDEDYIVKDWSWVDLSSLGGVDSLQFSLSSSDVGAFGMNTPAFFCVDNIELQVESSVTDPQRGNIDLNIYPNPAVDYVSLETKGSFVRIFDASGKLMKSLKSGSRMINVADLAPGLYHIRTEEGIGKFIKR